MEELENPVISASVWGQFAPWSVRPSIISPQDDSPMIPNTNIVKSLLQRGIQNEDLHVRQAVRLTDAGKKFGRTSSQLKIPLEALGVGQGAVLGACVDQLKDNLQREVKDVEAVSTDRSALYVKIKTHKFNQHVLRAVRAEGENYGYRREDQAPLHILVEYSSPNVAKPFHAGHLRSTLLGNFVCNLYEHLGHTVTRLNYLGDWGTQFGLLLTGYKRYGSKEKLSTDSLQHLFEVYVRVNADVEKERSRGSSDTYMEALHTFTQLETGEKDKVDLWEHFRSLSLLEYNKLYKRLGVRFTAVHYESMYRQEAGQVVEKLQETGRLLTDERGVRYVEVEQGGRTQQAKLMKSDGSSLYLSRDIAAALDRFHKYKFDRIHYVVDLSQRDHFLQLQGMLGVLGHTWSDRSEPHFHIAFGQIEGMSTRQGQVVFLKDLLDQARHRALESVRSRNSSRTEGEGQEQVAEELALSSIVVQDFRDRRRTNYTFNWERMLNFKADSGVFLQYCHARLCSVIKSFSVSGECSMSPEVLSEDIACRLVQHIARYPEVVEDAETGLEPCLVVHYLFSLGHLVNAAYRQLPVRNQDHSTQQARLALFDSSRQTLANGLQLLGISPLDKM